jgi:hypothetical protein
MSIDDYYVSRKEAAETVVLWDIIARGTGVPWE